MIRFTGMIVFNKSKEKTGKCEFQSHKLQIHAYSLIFMKNSTFVQIFCQEKQIRIPRTLLRPEGIFWISHNQFTLPKEIKFTHFQYFLDYLKQIPIKPVPIEQFKHILEMIIYIGWNSFAQTLIKQSIEPFINQQNCLKLLMICLQVGRYVKDRIYPWLNSLNKQLIGRISKNILSIFAAQPNFCSKIDTEVAQEIVQKGIKYSFCQKNFKIFLEILKAIPSYNKMSLISSYKLLKDKAMKKDAGKLQMNILKTINIQSNKDKQTSNFKLFDIWWRFVTKIQFQNDKKIIKIFLKVDSLQQIMKSHKLIVIYFCSSCIGVLNRNINFVFFIPQPKTQIFISKVDLSLATTKQIEFNLSLNIQYKMSLLLNLMGKQDQLSQFLPQLVDQKKALIQLKHNNNPRSGSLCSQTRDYQNQFQVKPKAQKIDTKSNCLERPNKQNIHHRKRNSLFKKSGVSQDLTGWLTGGISNSPIIKATRPSQPIIDQQVLFEIDMKQHLRKNVFF